VHRVEERLRQSERDWEDTFNTITDMITVHDKDFNILFANKAARDALRLPPLGDNCVKCFSAYHGSACPPTGCPSCATLTTGVITTAEIFEPHLNMFIEIRAIPRFGPENEIIGLIHVVRDISSRKRMEERLVAGERRVRTIIETVPEGVLLLDRDGTILETNPAGIEIIEADGPAQAAGVSLFALVLNEYRASLRLHIEEAPAGALGPIEFEMIGLKGTRRWLETRIVPLRDGRESPSTLLAVSRDVTDHKKLEAQLRHAQKMEAIGTLSSGIAHDFNNILTAIIGYANILKLKLKQEDPLRPHVDQILASSERATALTQSLLAFSRKTAITLRPVCINDVVRRAENLLRSIIGENIELSVELSGSATSIVADPGQIEQVLMNLATNARDAMPEGGSLTLSTEVKELGNEFSRTYGYGKPGVYVVITVSDTGIGMDDRTRERIFEPFFTTKDIGKGTGLGLSIVYGIVKQHRGYINCSSEQGRGTTFTVYLPHVKSPVAVRDPELPHIPKGGNETILLAEDDGEVRKLTAAYLRDFGYTILEADNGADAVRLFDANKDAVHLLVFDVVMPRMDGKEAYDAIHRLSPAIKILFMSGYSAATVTEKGISGAGLAYILKPVSPEALLRKVREVLDT
jgi:PAS domain S-box-containing protein